MDSKLPPELIDHVSSFCRPKQQGILTPHHYRWITRHGYPFEFKGGRLRVWDLRGSLVIESYWKLTPDGPIPHGPKRYNLEGLHGTEHYKDGKLDGVQTYIWNRALAKAATWTARVPETHWMFIVKSVIFYRHWKDGKPLHGWFRDQETVPSKLHFTHDSKQPNTSTISLLRWTQPRYDLLYLVDSSLPSSLRSCANSSTHNAFVQEGSE